MTRFPAHVHMHEHPCGACGGAPMFLPFVGFHLPPSVPPRGAPAAPGDTP